MHIFWYPLEEFENDGEQEEEQRSGSRFANGCIRVHYLHYCWRCCVWRVCLCMCVCVWMLCMLRLRVFWNGSNSVPQRQQRQQRQRWRGNGWRNSTQQPLCYRRTTHRCQRSHEKSLSMRTDVLFVARSPSLNTDISFRYYFLLFVRSFLNIVSETVSTFFKEVKRRYMEYYSKLWILCKHLAQSEVKLSTIFLPGLIPMTDFHMDLYTMKTKK